MSWISVSLQGVVWRTRICLYTIIKLGTPTSLVKKMKLHFIVILSSFLNNDLVKQLKSYFLKTGRGKLLHNNYNLSVESKWKPAVVTKITSYLTPKLSIWVKNITQKVINNCNIFVNKFHHTSHATLSSINESLQNCIPGWRRVLASQLSFCTCPL